MEICSVTLRPDKGQIPKINQEEREQKAQQKGDELIGTYSSGGGHVIQD